MERREKAFRNLLDKVREADIHIKNMLRLEKESAVQAEEKLHEEELLKKINEI